MLILLVMSDQENNVKVLLSRLNSTIKVLLTLQWKKEVVKEDEEKVKDVWVDDNVVNFML